MQQGAEFTFQPTVTLAGSITFQWPLHHRLLGSLTQLTSANIHAVDDDLKGDSAASRTIEPAM